MSTLAETLSTRLSHFVRNTLVGVLLPGLVLLSEIWLLLGNPVPARTVVDLPHAWIVLALVAGYASYIIGFASREIMFRLSDSILRRRRASGTA